VTGRAAALLVLLLAGCASLADPDVGPWVLPPAEPPGRPPPPPPADVAALPSAALAGAAPGGLSLARVLASLRALAPGRLTVLFGAGGDRDRTKRPHMGRVAAEGADRIVVTSDNPRTEDPERIVEEVAEGVGEVPHERIVDRREAIHRVLEEAEEGEIVLLAGKGHETYQVVGTERRPFDEARIVREYLDRRGTKERPRRGGIPS